MVTGADFLEGLGAEPVDSLADVGRLLLEPDEHLALVGVEADVVGDEADVARRLADDGLVVDLGLGGDLAEDHDHVGLGGRLAGDLGREEEKKKRKVREEKVEVERESVGEKFKASRFLSLFASCFFSLYCLSFFHFLTLASGSCSRHASRMASETCGDGNEMR